MTEFAYTSFNKCALIILSLIGIAILYLLAPVLMPFVAAALIAYLCNPLVHYLMKRWQLSRTPAAIIVFFIMIFSILLALLLLIPLIQQQISTLTLLLPNTITWFQEKVIPWLMNYFDINWGVDANAIKSMVTDNVSKAGGIASWVWQTTLHSGKALFEAIMYIILIPVVTFYFLRDWDEIIASIRDTLPRRIKPFVIKVSKECDTVLSAFFRGQLLVMLVIGIFYSVGLTLLGLDIGIIIGVIVGIITIVPYLGLIVGIAIASIAALVQFGTFTSLLWVWLLFFIGHSLENFYLTPKLIGDRIGLHPVLVIFAILAGGRLFGFFGILLALPVAAVLMVLLRQMHEYYNLQNHHTR